MCNVTILQSVVSDSTKLEEKTVSRNLDQSVFDKTAPDISFYFKNCGPSFSTAQCYGRKIW